MKSIYMHFHTREEISQKARNGCAIVVPLAATEQHGPHLPVFTDSLICEHVVSEAIRQVAESVEILMTPVITIGCSQHHLLFGGTLSYTSLTYMHMLRDIGESLVLDGFKKIIFINGHGGNEPIMIQTVNDLAVKHPIWVASTAYWSVSSAALDELNASEVGMVPGHAGGFETAAAMALTPELVRTDRMGTSHVMREWLNAGLSGTFIGKHQELTGFDGYTDAPYKATAEVGKIYLDAISKSVAAWLVKSLQTMKQGGEA